MTPYAIRETPYITALRYSQDEVLVPGWVEGLGFVAGVVSGVRVGRQVEGAEGVAQPRDVLAAQVPRPVHLQVTLQIRLLHTRRIGFNLLLGLLKIYLNVLLMFYEL